MKPKILLKIFISLLLISNISFAKNSNKTKIFTNETNSLVNELNFYQGTLYNNIFLDVDIQNYDVGVSLQNIPIYGGNIQNYDYDGYFNLSKDFNYNNLKLTFGTQLGTNLYFIKKCKHSLHEFSYINSLLNLNKIKLNLAFYHVNTSLATKPENYGFFCGIDLTLIENYATIQAQYISGHNNVSGTTINLKLINNKKFQPYVGVYVPETNSGNEFYGTFGLSMLYD